MPYLTGVPTPQDFNAAGNGVTDDTAAVQAALTAAQTSGGTLLFPAGTYLISSALTCTGTVNLEGLGPGVSVIHQSNTAANAITYNSAANLVGLTISGLSFTGPSSGSGIGIFLEANSGASSVSGPVISNVAVSGFGSHGISVVNSVSGVYGAIVGSSLGGNVLALTGGATASNTVLSVTGGTVASTGTLFTSATVAAINTLLVGSGTTLGDNGVGEIQLANASSPPSTNPTGGAVVYATAGKVTSRNPQGLVQTLSSVIQAQTSTTTITGVTAETVLHTVTIPANDPVAGAVYHLTGYGTFTAASGNLTWTVRWGGTSGTSIAALPTNTAPVLTNGLFWYDVTLTFRSTTSVTAAINLELGSSTSTDAATSFIGTPTAPVTVTTTGSTALTVDVTPSVSGDTINLLGGCARRLA